MQGGEDGEQSLPELRSAAAIVLVEGRAFLSQKYAHRCPPPPCVRFVKASLGQINDELCSQNPRLLHAARQGECVSVEGWRARSPTYNEEVLSKAGLRAVLLFFLAACLLGPLLSDARGSFESLRIGLGRRKNVLVLGFLQ